MPVILSIIGILITIFFVIGTHELGHFLVARWLGVKVLRFSIGFGKTLWQWQDRHNTEYVLALIPLGGYVKMLDEREEPVPTKQLPFAFNKQPLIKKILIVLAGPATNLLCAGLLYWSIFIIGFTAFKPIIGQVAANSIAAKGGLTSKQEIIAINQEPTPTWTKVMFQLLINAGEKEPVAMMMQGMNSSQKEIHLLDLSEWRINGLAPEPLQSLGIKPYEPPIPLNIDYIDPNSPAVNQLQIGDKLISIHQIPVHNWEDLIKIIRHLPHQSTIIQIERNGKAMTLPITIGERSHFWQATTGYLGIAPKITYPDFMFHHIQYSPLSAIKPAWQEVRNLSFFNLLLFQKLIIGKLSLETLGGPITIFETAGISINYGWVPFLSFLAFLSVSIAIINLFPIPGLDGGHVVILTIEALLGRPISEALLMNLYRVGFLLLFFILAQAMVNDLLRLY